MDSRNCQTVTVTPAEPGVYLFVIIGRPIILPQDQPATLADQSPEPDSGGFLTLRNYTYPQAHTFAKAEYFDKNPATLETMADVV